MVSVIIPVYNAEKYVAETLRSILQSDYRDIEVVCVDDGSTDRSAHEVEAVAQTDSRVRLLRQENGGVCRARNAAIAASRGKYILPIDADTAEPGSGGKLPGFGYFHLIFLSWYATIRW